ncbi:MAG: N-acetyl-alpha-D-muramate 1-phosphate uridylyltransferase [Micromonosporaceae bacterium]
MTEPSGVVAVVLAAGEGRRLRPLTASVPKALCPVGNVPLLDLALDRLCRLGFAGADRVAVNAWYLAEQIVAAAGSRAYVSVEPGAHPLGTAGGLGHLRDWIAGRGVLVANADAYLAGGDLGTLLDGWDGGSTRLLGVPGPAAEFGTYRFAGASLLPWHRVARLVPAGVPTDLVREVWRPAEAAGELDVVEYAGTYLDTGTPRGYLAANLDAAGGGSLVAPDAVVTGVLTRSVIGAGAVVAGHVTRAVVWPGGHVAPGEHLADAIRFGRSGTVSMSG